MNSIADSSPSAKGIYSPLDDSDEIRLLCLRPLTVGETIKCKIRHTKISSKTPYEALSYMWGPHEFRTIKINGVLCEVRINFGKLYSISASRNILESYGLMPFALIRQT
ncbi:hypothetical protein V8E51_011688 [Hyaloscypha variabilis]